MILDRDGAAPSRTTTAPNDLTRRVNAMLVMHMHNACRIHLTHAIEVLA